MSKKSGLAIGRVHAGWKIIALQSDGSAPRYQVEKDGQKGTLTYYSFDGAWGVLHQELAGRLDRWEGIKHAALLPIAVGPLDKGVFVIAPNTEALSDAAITTEEARAALESVAAALQVFHAKGLAHGELDPWCVVKDGTDGGWRLQPPGLRLSPPDVRSLGLDVDPRYAAPEVLDGQEPSIRSDLFSLGLILFRMVTGKAPVPGSAPDTAFAARGKTHAPSISKGAPNLKEPYKDLYRKLTALRPEQRPRDAQELLKDLQLVVKGKSPVRNPLPKSDIKQTRIGGTVLMLLIFGGVAGIGSWYGGSAVPTKSPFIGHQLKPPAKDANVTAKPVKKTAAKTGEGKTGEAKTDEAKTDEAKTGP